MSTVAPEVNALLAVLMDTPGLKQEQIGPMLHKLYDAPWERLCADNFGEVIKFMLEAWEG